MSRKQKLHAERVNVARCAHTYYERLKARRMNDKNVAITHYSFTSIDIGRQVNEASIASALSSACTEADIEHQVPKALLAQVAGDLYKAAGLAEGKELIPQEFEVADDATGVDRRLAVILDTLQAIIKRLEKIESLLEKKSS